MRTEIIIRATRTQNVLGLCTCVSDFNFVFLSDFHVVFSFFHLVLTVRCFSGEKGRRIRELTSLVQKRFNFPEGTVELYAEKVNNRGLCAIAQAESLRYKLLGGLAVRRYIPFRLLAVYYCLKCIGARDFVVDLIWCDRVDYFFDLVLLYP